MNGIRKSSLAPAGYIRPRTIGLLVASVSLVVVATLAPLASGAVTPIKSSQHFLGAVNGQVGQSVVYTVCAGPVQPGQLGPLLGGQTLLVVETPRSGGATGLFSHIYAWFVPSSGGSAPIQVSFKGYGAPLGIPTTVRVPCTGSGKVAFSSCPYLAPCAAGWTPYYVQVKLENVAA